MNISKRDPSGQARLHRLIKNSTPLIKGYLEQLAVDLEEADVRIKISNTAQVKAEGEPYGLSGYFSDDERTLAIAVGKPTVQWLSTLIHEHCHLRQFVERPKWWNLMTKDHTKFFEWMANERELARAKILPLALAAAEIEHDCEKRAVREIKTQGLDGIINLSTYVQKANAYINFYLYIAEVRSWYKPGQEPYALNHVRRKFPTTRVYLQRRLNEPQRQAFAACV